MPEDQGTSENQFIDVPAGSASSGEHDAVPGASQPTPAPPSTVPPSTVPPGSTQPGFASPDHGRPAYSMPDYTQTPYARTPYAQTPYGQPAHDTSQTSQIPPGNQTHSALPYGQPPFGQPPSGYLPYGDSPPPPARRRRLRSLLTYVTVAALAAGAGAGITAYALNNGSKPANSSSAPRLGSRGGFPNIGIPGFNPGPSGPSSSGRPVRSAAERAAVNAVRPGLVDISSNLRYQGSQAAATGMIISSNGYVLTNNHVITDTTQLHATIFATNQRYTAKWLGYDKTDDVAVIKLIGAHNLRTVPLGNSTTVKLGDKVIAIGNAYGQSVAQAVVGSITGLNRTITASDSGAATSETLHGMLQTNAGIVQGDSGGPLVSASGQVIGMDTAASTGGFGETVQNVGFAIPINRALQIAREIINNQSSSKIQIGSNGFLGVLVPAAAASQATDPAQQRQLQLKQDQAGSGFPVQPSSPVCLANDLNAGVPAHVAPVSSGALVIGELCGTPADKAGIIAGDVITVVAGHSVTSPVQLTSIMGGLRPGTAVQVAWVDVSGHRHTGTLVLVQAPPH